ncbi:MAG: hypothetical protein Q9215_004109 [Flavoplaca cf. flavocitrina]
MPGNKSMPPKDQKLGGLSMKTLKVLEGVIIPGSPEFQTMLREQLADGATSPQGASKEEKKAWKRPLANLKFLAVLEENIPRITRRLRFDYITLTKQCAKLLKSINQWGALGTTIGPQLRVAEEEIEKCLGTCKPQDLIPNFSILPCPARTPSDLVTNHWNIYIRHVVLSPTGEAVFFVPPDSRYIHVEGPFQTVEGQTPDHVLNPKSLVTLQTIARLIMKAFVEGMGADSSVPTSAPWTWATDEPNFARRIIKVMTDMGVRQGLVNMTVADADEMAACDEPWKDLQEGMMGG